MYLVTGTKGFIASHLCERLDNFMECNEIFEVEKFTGELPKAVFHLGAKASTAISDTRELAHWNILSSCKLLEWCIDNNIPFVYASSVSVYGPANHGFKEDVPMEPINYYAISKAAFDMFVLQKIKDRPDAKIFGLRYYNVYGSNEHNKGDSVSPVTKFIKQAKETGQIKVFEGSESYFRDFVSVDDVVDITLAAKDFKNAGIYNVGTGIPRTFLDIAKIISERTGSKIIKIPFPDHLIGKYQAFTKSDNTKLFDACKHKFLTLEQGIDKYFDKII